MKYIRKFAGWILLVEVVVACVLIAGLITPLPGKVEFKIVQSGSMEPALPVGSVIAVIPQAQYRVGDIITFGSDTRVRIPTTHRVVGLEREGGSIRYVTKGDANEEADNALVTQSEVIGGVILTIPRVGFVLDFARSRKGFMFMVVIPASLVVLDEIISIFTALRSIKHQRSQQHVSIVQPIERRRVPQTRRVPQPVTLARRRASMDGCLVIPPL